MYGRKIIIAIIYYRLKMMAQESIQNCVEISRPMPKREFSENIIVKKIPCLGRLHFVRDPEGYMALSFTTFYWIYGSFVNLFIILLPHYNDNQCPPELVLCRFSL